MNLIKKAGIIGLILSMLAASCLAAVNDDEQTITVSVENEAIVIGETASLSITDLATGNIIILDDKVTEKDGNVQFEGINLQKIKGFKVLETNITTHHYNEKDKLVIIRNDEDGGISAIITDTAAMPSEYMSEALPDLYEFFGLTEFFETVPREGYIAVAEKISAASAATEEEYINLLKDAVILYTVENSLTGQIMTCFEGIMEVTEKLEGYNALSSYEKEKLFSNVAGNKYNSVSEMLEELNNEIKSLTKKPSTGGGASSSGGGKVSSGITVSTPPVITEPEKNTVPEKEPFSDMENAKWAINAVDYLGGLGIINGYADNTFRPDNNVTRAEFVKMLVQLTATEETAKNIFGDVNEKDWFYSYVMKAYAAGFVRGDGMNFYPDNVITRQDMCVMCMNVLKYYGIETAQEEIDFKDAEEIAEYAISAVKTLAEKDIINGMPDGSFMPESNSTRAQAANVIYKLWNILEGI